MLSKKKITSNPQPQINPQHFWVALSIQVDVYIVNRCRDRDRYLDLSNYYIDYFYCIKHGMKPPILLDSLFLKIILQYF